MKLADVKAGDFVERWFGGGPKQMLLRVSEVTDAKIICGPWEFDRRTGHEIDEKMRQILPPGIIVSYIKPYEIQVLAEGSAPAADLPVSASTA